MTFLKFIKINHVKKVFILVIALCAVDLFVYRQFYFAKPISFSSVIVDEHKNDFDKSSGISYNEIIEGYSRYSKDAVLNIEVLPTKTLDEQIGELENLLIDNLDVRLVGVFNEQKNPSYILLSEYDPAKKIKAIKMVQENALYKDLKVKILSATSVEFTNSALNGSIILRMYKVK